MVYYSAMKRNDVQCGCYVVCYNIDKPQNVKWKKPVAKDFMLYDFIHMKCPVKQIYIGRSLISGYPEVRVEWGLTTNEFEGISLRNENILKPDGGDGYIIL